MAKKTVKKIEETPKRVYKKAVARKPTAKEQITALEAKVAMLVVKISTLKAQLTKRDRQLKRAKK